MYLYRELEMLRKKRKIKRLWLGEEEEEEEEKS
jgi:hypothetical protein